MSTTDDGTGPDEPRYGRRRPEGENPTEAMPTYGQPGAHDQSGGSGQQGAYGQQGGYGQPGQQGQYGQQGGYGQPGQQGQYGQQGGYGQQPYGAPAGYGQPGYGYGPGPSGPPPKRTGPVLMIVLSAIAMIAAPIIGFFVGVASIVQSAEGFADGSQVVNGGSLELPGDTDRVIYFASSSVNPADVACTVTGPGGQDIATSPDTFGLDVPADSAVGLGFRTTQEGMYTFECDLPAGDSSTLAVGPPLDTSDLAGVGVPVLVGLGVGFLAFILLIVGIVWLVRVNKRIRTGQY